MRPSLYTNHNGGTGQRSLTSVISGRGKGGESWKKGRKTKVEL